MGYGYSFQGFDANTMVKASLRNESISNKVAYEIANYIKGRCVDDAIMLLEFVIKQKIALPYKRYNANVSHKPGTGPGRYPKNASLAVIRLLKGVRSQAQGKGFDTTKVVIIHAAAQKSYMRRRAGRRSVSRKNAHFEVIVQETEGKKKKEKKQPAVTQKEEKRSESK